MKVLFVNMALDGHHLDYINTLCSVDGVEPIVIVAKKTDLIPYKQIVIDDCVFGSKKIANHQKWIKKVYSIAIAEKPDLVHFVYGDCFYRFFGIGFRKLCDRFNCFITFHQVKKDIARRFSIIIYGKLFSKIIVHTDSIKSYLDDIGIKNVVHIEYPNFRKQITISKQDAQKRMNVHSDYPVLLCLGGTRIDKGLDILLEALKNVHLPFHLLVAGEESSINRETIVSKIDSYKKNVTLILRFLSIEEVELCFAASDFIVLPYRKIFEGASGPLAEGVGYGKCIIGPDYGSLGQLIKKHHIGYVFKSEDVESLSQTISMALSNVFNYDEKAQEYREKLQLSVFKDSYHDLYLKNKS